MSKDSIPVDAELLRCARRQVTGRDVEIGTVGGVTAIAMARGLRPEGCPSHSSDARNTLHRIGAATATAVFLDGDKEGYVDYLPHAMRILRLGGLGLADNVFASGEVHKDPPTTATARGIQTFLANIARTKRLRSVLVAMGDGCRMGVKS